METGKLKKGIGEYNKYRRNLVSAKLIKTNEESFKILFEGNFCRSCGMDEYFQDLVYELERLGLDVELQNYKAIKDMEFIGEYKIV